eukprot:3977001-Prymnesium_polylepis.1
MAYTVLHMEPASSNPQLSPHAWMDAGRTICPLMGIPSDPTPEQRCENQPAPGFAATRTSHSDG